MPRANRVFLPGYVWHITHRCHRQQFLLRFARDRRRWRHWLFEARKRFGLCVLNYIATSNHIHLLVRDRGQGEVMRSMQLIAGCTAQEYNRRKGRRGAYWEDRYHATAVDTGRYLAQCLVYIDLNMVRAGVVRHPDEWEVSGYREIQRPPQRYQIIDTKALNELLGLPGEEAVRKHHHEWVVEALGSSRQTRDGRWTESLAVGSAAFVNQYREGAGNVTRHRKTIPRGDSYTLREPPGPYGSRFALKMAVLRQDNRGSLT